MTETERLRKLADDFAARNPEARHNPYDISTWGNFCGKGFATFKDSGGTHISKGARKSRGMASDGLARQDRLKGGDSIERNPK